MTQNKQIPALNRRALIDPKTVNDEQRTFDVVYATDSPVLIPSWWSDPYFEVLDMSGMRTERMDSNAPLLDNHDRSGSVQKNVLGRVVKHWQEGNKRMATVMLSKRTELDSLWVDIKQGIINDVSVGYRVYKYEEKPKSDTETTPTYIARDWESFEISLVAVPADPSAKVRSSANQGELNTVVMSEQNKPVAATEPAPANPTAAQPVQNTVDTERAIQEAIKAERLRTTGIQELVRTMRLSDDFAQNLISEGASIEQARERAISEWAKNDPARGLNPHGEGVKVGREARDKRRAAMVDGLTVRTGGKLEKGKEAAGHEDFRGMSLIRMAEEVLQSEGINTRGMSQREIATTALNLGRGYHSSSDFPDILASTVNRRLQAAYAEQNRTFMPFCRRGSAQDFRLMSVVALSGIVGSFDTIPEGGEYKAKTMTDSKEEYRVTKFGMKIGLTWEALINDDLSAFNRIPQAIANKAAQKQSDIVYGILNDNAAMGDGVALFHTATHGNLASSATGVTEAGLTAAKLAMRKQTGANGGYINVEPAYIIVGPAKEVEAQKILMSTIVPAQTSNVNVFRGFSELIVEPRLTDNRWFLSANPNQIDTIEYSFLQGEPDLFTEQRTGFDVDGLEIKARMVFGAKAIDWRGLYKNAGS